MQPSRPPVACRPPVVAVARQWTWVGRGGYVLPMSQRPLLSRHARVPTTLPLLGETSHAAKRCTAMALTGHLYGPQPYTVTKPPWTGGLCDGRRAVLGETLARVWRLMLQR